jgi:arabinose-5-phosphate isomerase
MSTEAVLRLPLRPQDQLQYARQIIELEAAALHRVAERLDEAFPAAAKLLLECSGSALVTGMGKAGLVGQKIAATLASTGTRSHFLHPAEAVHGDLGRVRPDDVVLALSNSGETDEIVRLLPALKALAVPLVAITGHGTSSLARAATVVIALGPLQEACPLGLAPSSSTTAMLAVGDALALVVSRLRQFGREDFGRLHPGGSLGRRLSKVEDHMRPLAECRVAGDWLSVREVFVELGRPGRRSGAIMLVDQAGGLSGLFTDSDLARLFERRRDAALDQPIHEVMTACPATVRTGSMAHDAVEMLIERKFSELPVVDERHCPVGMIDITDVLEWIDESGSVDAVETPAPPPADPPQRLRVVRPPHFGKKQPKREKR